MIIQPDLIYMLAESALTSEPARKEMNCRKFLQKVDSVSTPQNGQVASGREIGGVPLRKLQNWTKQIFLQPDHNLTPQKLPPFSV